MRDEGGKAVFVVGRIAVIVTGRRAEWRETSTFREFSKRRNDAKNLSIEERLRDWLA